MDIESVKDILKSKGKKESALWELVSLLQMENKRLASTISRLEEIENHHRKTNGRLREQLNESSLEHMRQKGL